MKERNVSFFFESQHTCQGLQSLGVFCNVSELIFFFWHTPVTLVFFFSYVLAPIVFPDCHVYISLFSELL